MITGPMRYGVASAGITLVLELLGLLLGVGILLAQNSPPQDVVLGLLFFSILASAALVAVVSLLFLVVLIVLIALKRPVAPIAYGFLGVLLVLCLTFVVTMGACMGSIVVMGVH